MIAGIGIDIVSIERIKRVYQRYGDRFTSRILTTAEIRALPRKNPYEYLAGRFAAKESIIKALVISGTNFNEIEVLNKEDGQPYVNNAAFLINKSGHKKARIHVSISHERENAIALCIVESV